LALAQEPRYSLGGAVVNSRTGEPVKRALVLIRPIQRAAHQPTDNLHVPAPAATSTFTDSGGAFRFEALAPGDYTVWAGKPEFTFVGDDSSAGGGLLRLTSSIDGLRLGLSPLGVITGKVVDQQGQSVRGANVVALSTEIQDGLGQIKVNRNVSTDDRGMYRLWSMSPGKYFVQATGLAGATSLFAGDLSPMHLTEESFAPVYFGGGKSLASAQAIEIEAGTEARADLSVSMERSYRIRGSLTNFAPRRAVTFELWSGEEDMSPGRVNVNGDTGKFEILDVVSGSYVLHARQGDTNAEIRVNVRGSDIEGLRLSLAGPIDVNVVTRFTNAPKSMNFNGVEVAQEGSCTTSLRPAGRRTGPVFETRPREKTAVGEVIHNVSPGQYRVITQCFGGYVLSAISGTQDLLENPTLTVQSGNARASIEITAAHGGAILGGKLALQGSAKPDHASILLVPRFSSASGPQFAPVRPVSERTNESQFFFMNLAPGDYSAYAFSSSTGFEYRNPQFLQSLPAGTPVHVEGEKPVSITITGLVQ
jgi:hypothetical protein